MRMGKKVDLNDFEHDMVIHARHAGLSTSETADHLGFSRAASSRVFREWSEKEKISEVYQRSVENDQTGLGDRKAAVIK